MEPGVSDFPPIADLLPHQPPMRWLEAVLAHDEEHTRCLARTSLRHPLASEEGVPAVASIEWIAQAAAAHAALRAGAGPAQAGVITSVRGLSWTRAHVPLDSELEVHVHLIYGADDPLAAFTGEVWLEGSCIATGRVHVLRRPPTSTPTPPE